MIRSRLRPLLAAALVTASSIGGGYLYFDTPAKYLGSDLVIGVNGTLPGWSHESPQIPLRGFDVELAEFIADELGFEKVDYRRLKPEQRVTALQNNDVDLVIANFSIDAKAWPDTTKMRRDLIDFAGPYYKDNSGIMYSEPKLARVVSFGGDIPVERVCASTGTTAIDYLKHKGIQREQHECFDKFADPADLEVVGVVTDQSILTAYALDQNTVAPARWADDPRFPIKENELYGVGMRKGTPGLCRRLNAAIADFREKRWNDAFSAHLSKIEDRDSHKPPVDPALCG
jgi:glutamate transport system substrate-binding protein